LYLCFKDEFLLRQEKNIENPLKIVKIEGMAQIDVRGKILLFDFDGTLVATEGLAKAVIETYFGQSTDADFYSEMIVGRTWKAATENMVRHAKSQGFDLDSPEKLAQEFKARYRERFEKGVQLIPGILDLLPKFQDRADRMGIVTGSERDEVETILKRHGLESYFSRIWAFGDYEHSKPDPSPFLTAMRDWGCDPSQCWVFEDSKAGMESAFQAKLKWVQIAYESHASEPDPRAECVIKTWDELTIL